MENKSYDFGIEALIKRVTAEYQRLEKEAQIQEAAEMEKLNALIVTEKKLKSDLEKARAISEKMMLEYSEIEKKIEAEKRRTVEQNSLKESDVKEGRISLREFFSKGKTAEKITEETTEQTQKELEAALKTIRGKSLEILMLERDLYQSQYEIRFLAAYPGRIMGQKLKTLNEFLAQQMSFIIEDITQCKSMLDQTKDKILLTQGKSLAGRFAWYRITAKEANRIAFDPIFPEALVAELKTKLAKIENKDKLVNVTLYFAKEGQPAEVDVEPCLELRRQEGEILSTHGIGAKVK
jgi:hypothetical protein